MPTDDLTAARGIEMSRADIDEVLEELGHGTLSLASDEEVYGVPISFGYDGDRLFLSLVQFGDESKKLSLIDHSTEACLTAYHTESRFEWRSVIVQGTIVDVDEDESEYAQEVLDDNAWFPTIYPPTSPMTDVRRVELNIEEASGRRGEGFQ